MKNLLPRSIHYNFKAGNFSGELEAVSLFVDISDFAIMTTRNMYGKANLHLV